MINTLIDDDELTLCRFCCDLSKTSATYEMPIGTEISIRTSCMKCSNPVIRKIVVSEDYIDIEDDTECKSEAQTECA